MNNYDYGVIGNGRTSALVSRYGSIDWCCLPDFDSPSVFAALLDKEKGGSCSVKLAGTYRVSQHYFDKTNILVTTFDDGTNKFELIDFMPRYKTDDDKYYTPPEIYRFVRVKQGRPRVAFCYNPRLNYAQGNTIHEINGEFIRSLSKSPSLESVYLYSSLDLHKIVQCEEFDLEGDNFLLISYHQKAIPIDIDRVYIEYQRTKVYWLNWVNRSKVFREYNQHIQRSLLVLKLLSYQKTGALVAAVTTSLPESIGKERNWDYRYCWIRDASMTIETLIRCGHFNAARRFMNFITNVIRSKEEGFQIMYGIRYERNLKEKILYHLSGYENSKPVRVGNDAYKQVQHDIYGFLMDILYQYFHYFSGTLDEVEEMWSITKNIVRHVGLAWNQPDSGIWEFRGIKRHFVFSKVLSWVALDRAIKIAHLLKKDSV
ncbi:MAG TPA: glycoside hydrolase family 15 protein, partial [Bacteroidales bacterium]|nr:glycoside hydrolase family 15 protein [Bacteroidales bacterium]